MTVARRNHYVTQFYLRSWCEPNGMLRIYKRGARKEVVELRRSPKATAFEEDLYTARSTILDVPEPRPDVIETQFFQKIDDDASKVLTKLIANDPLSADESVAWARFLHALIERDPRHLARNDTIAQQVAADLISETRTKFAACSRERLEHALARFDVAAAARNTVLSAMVHEIRRKDVLDHLTKQAWLVLPMLEGLEYITSDRPLLVNGGETSLPFEWMSIALSPVQLFLSCPRSWEGEDELLRQLALAHNFMVIQSEARFLYSRGALADDIPVGNVKVNLRRAAESAFGVG